jgi:hypothetical protein
MEISRWMFYIIPLVVLIILGVMIYGDNGLFPSLKKSASGMEDYLPNISFGAEGIEGIKPELVPETSKAVNDLINTIKSMKDKQNCFVQYNQLPLLKGKNKDSYKIIFTPEIITIMAGPEGKQVAETIKIEGIKPCLIAGKINNDDVIKLFQNYFDKEYYCGPGYDLNRENMYRCQELEKEVTYTLKSISPSVESLMISYYDGWFSNTNQLSGIDYENTWLYTPDGKNICFFNEGNFLNNELAYGIKKLIEADRLDYCK